MSKQKSSESSSASGSGQTWAQPYAQQGANAVSDVFNQNQPHLQGITDTQRQNVVDPLISQFQNTQGPANQASGYYSDVLNGKYMNGNPYMGQVMDATNRGISDNVNSQFEGAGRYGSDAYAGTLARETGAADANLQYNNYNDRMNQMGQAAGGATGASIGTEQALAGAVGQNAALPYLGSSAYAGSLGQLMSGGTSSSVGYSPNPIWGAIGAGLGAAGQIASAGIAPGSFSDRRLKTNITKVGQFADGLGIYEYNYRAGQGLPTNKMRGVMADETRELRPQAYIHNFNGSGFAGVDYSKL